MPRVPARVPAAIDVFAGLFESQQLCFAHLYDLASNQGADIDLGEVDVICKTDPAPRLAHYFNAQTAHNIATDMGLNTTLVLVFEGALEGTLGASDRLHALGRFQGSRLRA
ncbi:MAG: hypothetical protein AAF092_10270 [Pseudomonadota bacterium]